MNWTEISAILPLICLSAGAVFLMMMIAVRRHHAFAAALTVGGLVAALATLPRLGQGAMIRVTPLLVVDRYTVFYIAMFLAAAIVVVVFVYEYFKHDRGHREECYLLLLLATLGACLLAAAAHFASLFLGLEILSVSLYTLVSYLNRRRRHVEAGVKYLILAAVSSAFLLFGMALFYAGSGAVSFGEVKRLLFEARPVLGMPWLMTGAAMIVVGIGFKLAVAPFHWWTPDIYQGAPAPVTAFVATISKGGLVALLMRLFPPADLTGGISIVLAAIAILSMLTGNLLALLQDNVKRILAYSSIAHLGYLLVAVLSKGPSGTRAATFYLATYFVTTLGAFGVVTLLSGPEGEAENLADYRGLFWRRPWLAGSFAAMILSLAGLPLTAGFMGKFYVAAAGVESGLWTPVIVLVATSTIGLYYYLRIAATLFSRIGPTAAPLPAVPMAGGLILAGLTFVLVWIGILPTPLLDMIRGLIG